MDSGKKKILIADDEPDILEIVGYNLQTEGYTVIKAKDGLEAIELALKHQPDLIILDVMMPHKTGMEVCQLLRSKPEFAHILIIMLTAVSDESSHVKGLEYGADDYINKPISPKVLISRINALFRRTARNEEPIIKVGNITIDKEQFIVRLDK
ncbi:MAG: response regulator transcription factor, partial [Bacteroidota bacterium]